MNRQKSIIALLIIVNIFLISAFVFVLTGGLKSDGEITEVADEMYNELPVETDVSERTEQTEHVVTIKEFLKKAMEPVGETMYVYGGGWNKEDTGAGEYAVTIGVAEEWRRFYEEQDSSYNSSEHRYEITKGLDCSGYLGWTIYNTLETENGKSGYVFFAEEYADKMSGLGFGEKTNRGSFSDYFPGDIMSSKSDSHVWISLGQCSDGSVVLVNSSPPGVRICGTATPDGNARSEAVEIAEEYMSAVFPDWYARYPECLKNTAYLTNYDRFRWYTDGRGVMTDPEGYLSLTPKEILSYIFYG